MDPENHIAVAILWSVTYLGICVIVGAGRIAIAIRYMADVIRGSRTPRE